MKENKLTMTRPGEGLKTKKMPGHWVLARMGKRVLRPGGIELTRRMLEALNIQRADEVVEFAPGMGVTARLTLALAPSSYTAVERDEAAAKIVNSYLAGDKQRCVVGSAAETGLPDESATVVYGEAMLTMQTEEMKRQIVREAKRLLRSDGRYGIHEMCISSDDLNASATKEIERALTGVVHHGVKPLAVAEWRLLLESEGFAVQSVAMTPMALLEPRRIISDEGFGRALRFAWNLLRDRDGRQRVLEMRSVFRRHRKHLAAVTLIGVKH
jgi:ubiquinone/menaquinone biosynthesis C-methylase UbiE